MHHTNEQKKLNVINKIRLELEDRYSGFPEDLKESLIEHQLKLFKTNAYLFEKKSKCKQLYKYVLLK